jgi:adenosylcobyric acid synthase
VSARTLKSGIEVNGYEIHIGVTSGPDCDQGWLEIDGRKEGAISKNEQVHGCYLHGLFASDGFRTEYLKSLGVQSGLANYKVSIDETLDELAGFIEDNLDFNQLIQLAKTVPKS